MGRRRTFRLHGRRSPRIRHPRQRDLPGKRRHGILRAYRNGLVESAASGRCCPRRRSHRHTRSAKLPQRDPPSATSETVGGTARPGAQFFLLTIVVTTTILPPCPCAPN